MTTLPALNLQLVQRDPLENRQDLCLFAMSRLPDHLSVIATLITAKGLPLKTHRVFTVSSNRLLDKISQKRRK
jgi:hypothetical protein